MGSGAFMNVVNNRPDAIHISLSNVQCMRDHGDQGSNLSLFDNATVQPGGALPSAGGQYLEVNDTGGCFFDESTFTLTFKDAADNVISAVTISESLRSWYEKSNSNWGLFDVSVSNNSQAHITLTAKKPPPPPPPVTNRWVLSCQNRVANIWYDNDYTVYGLNPVQGGQQPGDSNVVRVYDRGDGTLALQCGGGHNAYASMRDDYGYQVQFQAPNGTWVTQVNANEIFQAVPTGDGYFALYSPHFRRYVTINSSPNGKAGNCNALYGGTGDIHAAARFTALGQDHPSVLDVLRIGKDASGMSFAGVDLSGLTLSGNLSQCDFRQARNLGSCTMNGAVLKRAEFGGAHLAGLRLSGADCTGADFTGCDFTGFTPGTPPPVLAGALLAGAVLPAGHSWSGANMPGAVLAGANLTGCDLSGPATNLTGASFSGTGVTVFNPGYQNTGIGGYDLRGAADQVLAYDGDGAGHLDYLVCYRPGRGAVAVVRRQDGTFGHVYLQGDPGSGIGGYPLDSPADRIIAYDYADTGHLDHLLCYRPGAGRISILEKGLDADNKVTFTKVFDATSGGIGDFKLDSPADRIIAYDYANTGRLDHLLCYRPGAGLFSVLEKQQDERGTVTFAPVAGAKSGGIGPWDLASPADQVLAYDGDGSGHLSCLVCFRPGSGAVAILKRNGAQYDDKLYFQGAPGSGIGGYDLGNPADQIIAYDYGRTGNLDHLACYRPGVGLVSIIGKKPDGTYAPAWTSWGATGIGGYDLRSPADQIIAYDDAGTGTPGKPDDLVCYRPGSGTIWVIENQVSGPPTLTGCALNGANLSAARLGGVDLRPAGSLQGANLTGTSLAGATLAKVNLTGTTLTGTDFTGTDLTQTVFSSPLGNSADPQHPTIFAGCTLPFAVIGLNWSCLDLTGTTITGLPTSLAGLNAAHAVRPRADFTGYVLDRANFAGAVLDGTKFSAAKLRQKPSFAGASLLSTVFNGAVLDEASFAGAALGGVQDNPAADFSFAYLSNCDFTQARMYAASFANATLAGANKLAGATDLQATDFSGAYLPGADFTGADLRGVIFDDAFMVECILTGADLTPAGQGTKAASFSGTCLQAALLDGTKLARTDLGNAIITNIQGQIDQQHRDQNGKLTSFETVYYPAASFPTAASFSDETICPNLRTYGTNVRNGLTMAQMMTPQRPVPAQWSPPAALAGKAAAGDPGGRAAGSPAPA